MASSDGLVTQLFQLRGFTRVVRSFSPMTNLHTVILHRGDQQFEEELPHGYLDWPRDKFRAWVDATADKLKAPQIDG